MDESYYDNLKSCDLCPRHCHADRSAGKKGYCGLSADIRAARAALHYWEEPVLSGTDGSGAVFFSGCNLRCVFCQNYSIAIGENGKVITPERLTGIYFELKEKGAHNINLVTGTPYIPQIAASIEAAKAKGFDLPFVFNCGGYENVRALKMLDGLVDIYLPDMKYYSSEISTKYSNAPDYFERAKEAIAEMFRQVGEPILTSQLMKRGMIVRHMLLPGYTKDSKKILRYLHETYGNKIYISIMNQYTPMDQITNGYPELTRKVTDDEYERVIDFAIKIGIEKAFIQEGDTAEESFIPAFDNEGL